ncbi:MAG TPA: trimethylamine methyltransferase, partial [Clostridia bacterium]|nr:trimethylamine methyltransferase [Clostridia bacterium]
MHTNLTIRKTAGLQYLSQDQILEVHRATLEVLETTGVKVFEEEALALLREAGAEVEGNSVRIPGYLIEEAIRMAPKRISLANRNGRRTIFLEGGRIYFGTGSDTPYILDTGSGKIRSAVKADVEVVSRICDYLPNIDFVMSMGLLSDYHPKIQDIHQFIAMLTNTVKPIIFTSHNRKTLEYKIAIAEEVAGSSENLRRNPFLALYTEPSSPLMHSREAVEKLLLCAEKGIPVVYTVGIMAGATAPITSAGLMVTANAELLSGLLMAQLKKKGAPVIYGGMVTAMDMATGIFSYSAPELYRRQAAMSEMSKFYGLPIFGVGGCSDACIFDVQAGIEQGYTLLMAALSGVNL